VKSVTLYSYGLYLIQTLLYFANITMWRTLRERRNPYAERAMPTPHKLKYPRSIFLAPLASLSILTVKVPF